MTEESLEQWLLGFRDKVDALFAAGLIAAEEYEQLYIKTVEYDLSREDVGRIYLLTYPTKGTA
jgi:hypothetical protein